MYLSSSTEVAGADDSSLLNTVDDTTKGLPIVGGVTSPLLKTVGGVTDQLPIVSLFLPYPQTEPHADMYFAARIRRTAATTTGSCSPKHPNLCTNANTKVEESRPSTSTSESRAKESGRPSEGSAKESGDGNGSENKGLGEEEKDDRAQEEAA